jgi:DNA-binding MarR family transcriptional regulator
MRGVIFKWSWCCVDFYRTFTPMSEICQKEWHRLRTLLLEVNNQLRVRVGAIFDPYGLTFQQYNALQILQAQSGKGTEHSFSTQDLRAALWDKSADSSRLVSRLVQKGWVNKQVCPADSRRVSITLSEAGAALLTDIEAQMATVNQALQSVSVSEAQLLNELLSRIEAGFGVTV